MAFSSGAMKISVPLVELRWMMDRAWMVAWTLPYLIGALVLSSEYSRTEDMVVRQQLKWLRNGAFCGILPFAVFYVLPYVLGAVPNSYMKMSVLSVVLDSAHAGLRDRALPADGRGHHLPARLRVHSGHPVRAGRLLRHRLLARRPGETELPGPGQHRPDDRDADHGVPLPTHPQLDAGTAGPAFLPRPLRLPPDPGGVRP